jgi:hypothetical protein
MYFYFGALMYFRSGVDMTAFCFGTPAATAALKPS